MGRDWDQATFTDLKVVDEVNAGCPQGWKDAYSRLFYGITMACDCFGIYGRNLATENVMVIGPWCDRN